MGVVVSRTTTESVRRRKGKIGNSKELSNAMVEMSVGALGGTYDEYA